MHTALPVVSFRYGAVLAGVIALAASCSAPPQSEPEAQPEPGRLPSFLEPVPAGRVWVGLESDQLVRVASEAINPRKPERADEQEGGGRG